MTAAIPKRKPTAGEYLAFEQSAESRHEFVNGEIVAMAGGSVSHNRVKENLVGEMYAQLKPGPCQSFSSDQRVLISQTGMYAYPDIVIVCGKVETDPLSPMTITNPRVVIEVLSPTTEGYDRGFKAQQYCQSPTLREYILVSPDRPRIERFARTEAGSWDVSEVVDLAGELVLESVAVKIPLADIYRNVDFPAGEKP